MMLRLIVIFLLLVVFSVGASIGYFNAETVRFHYLVGSVDIRLAVLVVAAFALGVVLTVVFTALRLLALNREIRRLRRQLRDTETELKNLRNLPLAGSR